MVKKQLNVLIACEESQAITKVFRELGHQAFSCDIKQCSGGHPEWHIQGDALVIANQGQWDLMIAHPPCTFLTVSGNRWFYHPEDKHLPMNERRPHPRFPNRREEQKDAYDFFVALSEVDVPHIAIENPVGVMPTLLKKNGYEGWLLNKPQYVQPYWFGDKVSKKTGFWCKGLPLLTPTVEEKDWDKGEMTESGMSKWYSDALRAKTAEERRTIRSKTHPNMAKAIAMQWSEHILNSSSFKLEI